MQPDIFDKRGTPGHEKIFRKSEIRNGERPEAERGQRIRKLRELMSESEGTLRNEKIKRTGGA